VDRAQLRTLLAGGPSRRFNALEVTLKLEEEGRADETLFRHGFLNRAIVFKHLDHRLADQGGPVPGQPQRPVNTLIYMPYDPHRPGDGGEAMLYSRANIRRLYAARTNTTERPGEALLHDEAILDILDELPALNPFLLREAFERAGRPSPEPYLALDREVTHRLQRRLHRRVRPLVVAAFGAGNQAVGGALDNLVEAFVRPDKSHLLTRLGGALRLSPETAPEVLSAWASIAFFEDELARLKPAIRGLAQWLAEAAGPLETLGQRERRELEDRFRALRASVREAWRQVRGILEAYQQSYDALVFDDDPQPFTAFLRRCRGDYWRMGDLFGRFEQACHAWQLYTAPFGTGPLPVQLLDEFLRFLDRTFSTGGAGGDLLDDFTTASPAQGARRAPPPPPVAMAT
jgi:hypothetical protein